MATYNFNVAFTHLCYDEETGEISMSYTVLCSKDSEFNTSHFSLIILLMHEEAEELYSRLCHLAVGKIAIEKKQYYRSLLTMALDTLNGKEISEDRITYGTDAVKRPALRLPSFLRSLHKTEGMDALVCDEDDCDEDGSDDDDCDDIFF